MEKAASVRRQTDGEAGKVMPIIDRTYPLGQAREAMRYLEEDHARRKLVIRRSSSQYEARTRLRLPVVSSLRLDQKTTTDPGIRGYRMRPYRPRRVNGGDLCVARRASRVAHAAMPAATRTGCRRATGQQTPAHVPAHRQGQLTSLPASLRPAFAAVTERYRRGAHSLGQAVERVVDRMSGTSCAFSAL
jgi:hypothetical protein